ncbi:MAG: GNAT family N-acetyltransferase [Pseudomonadota bacterium]
MSHPFRIIEDPITGPEIRTLLADHLEDMHAVTPPESVHALDIQGLQGRDITFWSIWDEDTLLGCGALKDLGDGTGEIKSMRTAEAFRGRGVGACMLEHIIKAARSRGYSALYLETGSMEAFAPALALYTRFDFDECGPFGEYQGDPNSTFMWKQL